MSSKRQGLAALAALCAAVGMVAAQAGTEPRWSVASNRIDVTTDRLTAGFAGGALVGLVNRASRTDYMAADASLDASAANVALGLLTTAVPGTNLEAAVFANDWWDDPIKPGNPAIHRPAARSAVVSEVLDPRHARQTVTGLAAGDRWFAEERLVLDLAVMPPDDELEVRLTVSSPTPGVFGASLGTLGWRRDFRRITPDTDGRDWGYDDVKTRMQQSKGGMDSTSWPSYWRFPFVIGYVPGRPGACLIWSEDTDYRCRQQFTRHEPRQTDLAFGTQALPPFKDLKECRSAAWRIQAFAGDWRAPADRYRASLVAQGILKDRPAWAGDVTVIYLGSGAAPWEREPLAAFFTPDEARRVVVHAQGWRKAGFDNNLWDYTPYDGFGADVAVLREHGFRVMAYMQPMFCRWVTKPGMEDPPTKEFNDVYSFKNPFTGQGWGAMHLGLDAYRKWFEGKASDLTATAAVQAIYLDSSFAVHNDARGRIDGKTSYEGMLTFCHELRAQHPDFGFATEGVMSLNAALVNWGISSSVPWGNFSPDPTTGIGACAIELAHDAHPIVTYILRDYFLQYIHGEDPNAQASFHLNEDYAERRATMATAPQPVYITPQHLEGQLMLRKAKLFAARGLKPYFPPMLEAGVRSYYRAADGTVFRYLERPYGSCLTEEAGQGGKVHYARVHGVTDADLPEAMNVPGWAGRDRHGLIGLNPEYYYCAFPDMGERLPVELTQLPKGAFIRQCRISPDGLALRIEWLDPAGPHPASAKIGINLRAPVLAVCGAVATPLAGPVKAGSRTLVAALPGTLVIQTAPAHAITLPWSLVRQPGVLPRVTVSRRNGLPEFPANDTTQAVRQVAHGVGADPVAKTNAPAIREAVGTFNKLTYQDYWLTLPKDLACLRFMPRMSREFKEARMSVAVNGQVLWEGQELFAKPLTEEVAVDLTPYAGQTVLLTLASDSARHSDWFVWFNPRLEARR